MREIWTPKEKKLLTKLYSPRRVQHYLDSIDYDPEGGYRSPRYVMRERKAQCFSGAIFAAAALKYHGYTPLIMELTAENDDNHIMALFERNGCLGVVSKSNFTTLGYREPVYRNLRELAMSFFSFYFNIIKELSLRSYSVPVDLSRFNDNWIVSEENSSPIEEALDSARHYPLITPRMKKSLEPVDEKLLKSSLLGSNLDGLFKPKRKKCS